jgi:hypothetical protein
MENEENGDEKRMGREWGEKTESTNTDLPCIYTATLPRNFCDFIMICTLNCVLAILSTPLI